MAYRKVEESSLTAVADAIRARSGSSEALEFPDGFVEAVGELPVGGAVTSVNGQTGAVQLSAADVGALSADTLPGAVDDALAQAKASGEFDGEKGDNGDPGEIGPTGPKGDKGEKGADGYTPVRGVDYWTDADQEAIVQDVVDKGDLVKRNQGSANVGKILVVGADGNLTLTDMPTAMNGDVVGVLDENNNIVIKGDLADGTYTFKYENTDGTYAEIGTLMVGGGDIEPTYTNIIDTVGYTNNKRVSTSSGELRDAEGYTSTGIIDLTSYAKPRVLRTKGVDFRQSVYTHCNLVAFDDANGTFKVGYTMAIGGGIIRDGEIDEQGNLTLSSDAFNSYDYIRFSGYGDGANLIVTVNEEITD